MGLDRMLEVLTLVDKVPEDIVVVEALDFVDNTLVDCRTEVDMLGLLK